MQRGPGQRRFGGRLQRRRCWAAARPRRGILRDDETGGRSGVCVCIRMQAVQGVRAWVRFGESNGRMSQWSVQGRGRRQGGVRGKEGAAGEPHLLGPCNRRAARAKGGGRGCLHKEVQLAAAGRRQNIGRIRHRAEGGVTESGMAAAGGEDGTGGRFTRRAQRAGSVFVPGLVASSQGRHPGLGAHGDAGRGGGERPRGEPPAGDQPSGESPAAWPRQAPGYPPLP